MEAQRSTQQQEQHPHDNKQRAKRRFIIVTIVILILLPSTLLIFSILGIIPGIWASIIAGLFTICSLAFAIIPLVSPNDKSDVSTIDPPGINVPTINIYTSLTTPSAQPIQPAPLPSSLDRTTHRRFESIPPPSDPKAIQQREQAVRDVYEILIQPDITAIALTGIGGIGKSTLAALIYRYVEAQQCSDNGPFTAPPIWLRIDPSATMAEILINLSESLNIRVPDESELSPQNQAVAMFRALNSVDKPCLVVLDQFENVLDDQGCAKLDRPGIGELLDALNSERCVCRILLTSRPDPHGTHDYPATYLQFYNVEGLSETEGIELLHKWNVTATEMEIRTAIKRCSGHTLSLVLLTSLLQKRNISLKTLLEDEHYKQLWIGDIAKKLLAAVFDEQLDALEQKLLAAISIYREPVPLNTAQCIFDDLLTVETMQLETALDRLLVQHLLQATGEGYYQPHAIVAEYARGHIVVGNEQSNRQALLTAHAAAAKYYREQAATTCPPKEKRRKISDVHDLVEAVWHHCQAEQFQEALDLTEVEGIFRYLSRWSGSVILLELYQLLLPDKWRAQPSQAAIIYRNLGDIYRELDQPQKALFYLEQALSIRREIGDRKGEGTTLNSIGRAYTKLGKKQEALAYYEQALSIRKEIGDREGQGSTLNNLGYIYNALGQKQRAVACYEQALCIHREVGNRAVEGTTLNNLGYAYFNVLGQKEKAVEYYNQALSIHRELGARRSEGTTLNNLGRISSKLGQNQKALAYYKQALVVRREVGIHRDEGRTLWNIGMLYFEQEHFDIALACFLLAKNLYLEAQSPRLTDVQQWIGDLHKKVGEEGFTVLLAQVEPRAFEIVEKALSEDVVQDTLAYPATPGRGGSGVEKGGDPWVAQG